MPWLFVATVHAQPPAGPLPSPLTLGQALALADEPHPDLDVAQADIARARARVLEQESRQDTRAYFDLTPEWVNPATGGGGVNDSRARILLSKQLTDFGRTRALESAARDEVAGRELAFLDARQRRRLEIMARFFDVLLADLRYAVDNEEMAHRYVVYDRVRERHALGQVSEVERLEYENRYREALITRTESQKRQSSTRLQLAHALNRADELPGELVAPAPTAHAREIPDYKALSEAARRANPVLAALRKESEAARAGLEGERARRRPTLNAEVEAGEYERALQARSTFRAGLNLRVPLYQGGEVDAAVTRAAADLAAREARLKRAEHDLQQTVLDAVQELETLKVRREAAQQRVAFRDLYLDRARARFAQAQHQAEQSRIVAPFDAWVLEVRVQPGQQVVSALEARPLVVLAAAGEYLARTRVSGSALERLAPGTAATVTVAGKQYAGKVLALALEAGKGDEHEVAVAFHAAERLRAGQSAKVEFGGS